MKHNLSWFFIIIVAITLTNCNSRNESDSIKTIDVLEGLKTEKEVLLSEFIESVEYVKLETNTESFLKYPEFQITSDYIIAADRYFPAKVLLFKRNGEFIRQLGATGKGPGEYMSAGVIARNNDFLLLHDYGLGKLMKYNYSGEFIKSINYLEILDTKILQILPLDNGKYALCMKRPTNETTNFPLIRILNENLEFEQELFHVNTMDVKFFGVIHPSFYLKEEKIHLREFYYDTLYVQNTNEFISEYHFLIKSNSIPERIFSEDQRMNYTDYNRVNSHADLGAYFSISIQKTGDNYFSQTSLLYNKNTKEIFSLNELPTYEPDSIMNEDDGQNIMMKNPNPKMLCALYNDIDGFYHLKMDNRQIDDHYINNIIYRKYDVNDLKEFINKGHHLKQNVKFPEKRDELTKIIMNSSEDDNPVLQIFHLKKKF